MNDTNQLIDAAEEYAASYDGDDRECIKTDVMNAFYAGAAWREQHPRAVEDAAPPDAGHARPR